MYFFFFFVKVQRFHSQSIHSPNILLRWTNVFGSCCSKNLFSDVQIIDREHFLVHTSEYNFASKKNVILFLSFQLNFLGHDEVIFFRKSHEKIKFDLHDFVYQLNPCHIDMEEMSYIFDSKTIETVRSIYFYSRSQTNIVLLLGIVIKIVSHRCTSGVCRMIRREKRNTPRVKNKIDITTCTSHQNYFRLPVETIRTLRVAYYTKLSIAKLFSMDHQQINSTVIAYLPWRA